jgi:hypothetical protein
MGTLITIECLCGYQSDGIDVRYCFAGPDKGYQLNQCRVYHFFGASVVLTKENRCSYCRSRRVRVFEEELPAGPLTSLSCGRPTAVALEAGPWD